MIHSKERLGKKMANKKQKKSKSENKTGTTTMSLIIASLKYQNFICKGEFPEIIYFTDCGKVKSLKVKNHTEYFNSTMYIEMTINNKNVMIDTDGNIVKPISVNKNDSTKTYSIPFVGFLKTVKSYMDDEDIKSASVYAIKETRTNKMYWPWLCGDSDVGIIHTPKNTIYVNFEI